MAMWEITRIIRRHSHVVVVTTAILVAAALLFVAMATPLYTSTASILLEPQRLAVVDGGNRAPAASGVDDAMIDSQVALLQSPSVMERVVDILNLTDDPEFVPPQGFIDWIKQTVLRPETSGASADDLSRLKATDTLRRHLTISRQHSRYLINISASSHDRTKAAAIANAVAQAYFAEQARSKFDATKAAVGRFQNQLEQLKSRAAKSARAVDNYRAKAEAGTAANPKERQRRLVELQHEADVDRAVYEGFLAREKASATHERVDSPASRLVDRAQPSISPSFPDIPLAFGSALMIGLSLGCLLALLADGLDPRIKTQEQAQASGLPSLAALPEINVRELAHLSRRGRADLENYDPRVTRLLPIGLQPPLLRYAVTQPMSPFAEAIRSIRFALQHETRLRNAQVISVTSAVSGEGKTTVAANLAQSLSVLGVKTILVEGDLRNPQLSRALCPSVQCGLLQVALEEMPLNQAVLVDPLTDLAFIPAPLSKNIDIALLTEFALSEGMRSVLTELRNHFDVLIVDAPPLLPLVDGRALVEQSDAVILTVGWDYTPREVFLRAVELLNPVRDRIIGTVLTRVDVGRLKLYEPYGSSAYSLSYFRETTTHGGVY
jgi:capsular exopolysaccharide synthesis family protein